MDVVEHLTEEGEEGGNVTSVFLDLSEEFDCLEHDLIRLKLSSFGVQETALRWFSSHFTD